jgi:hypothetical protein
MLERPGMTLAITSLILVNLACTLGGATTAVPAQQVPSATLPALAPAQPAGTPLSITVQPAGTPRLATAQPPAPAFPTIGGQPTLGPTTDALTTTSAPPTDSAATISAPPPTQTAAPAPTATQTKVPATSSPLAFTYEVIKIIRNPDNQAVLTLHIIATGGAGGYKYYHDDVLKAGNTFDVAGTCGAKFTHTLKVQSTDGQTVALPYQVAGVCPAPTATPT